MPWYKLPHSTLNMWFGQKMPDLKPGRKPSIKHVKPQPAGTAAVDEWLKQVKPKEEAGAE